MIWAILLRHWDKIVGVLLVLAVIASIYAWGYNSSTRKWKPKYDQVQETLTRERESYAEALRAALSKQQSDYEIAIQLRDRAVERLGERIAFHSDTATNLLNRLRSAERGRVRPLAPAQTAPAECSNYESDPTRLPDAARVFLIGEATAAERNAEYLETCRTEFKASRLACGQPVTAGE